MSNSTSKSHARIVFCNHDKYFVSAPGNIFIRTTQPAAQMNICACGKNAVCPVCGFGWGSIPCDCNGGMFSRITTGHRITTSDGGSYINEEGS